MANNNSGGSDSKFPFNVIVVIFLVFAIVGLAWLGSLDIKAGNDYFRLLVVGIIFLLVVFVAHRVSNLDFWFDIPISRTAERSVVMMIIGVIFLLGVILISTLTGLNFYNAFIISPMTNFASGPGASTFSALQAFYSPFWTFFILVFSAAVIEEIVLGWAFVAMGSLIGGYGLRRLLKLDFGGGGGNDNFDFIMAMLFSIIFFTVWHTFNQTYFDNAGQIIVSAFLYAAVFRLVLNVLIYRFGHFGLMFAITVHGIHNAIVLVSDPKTQNVVVDALLSFPGGIILDVLLLLMIYFGITSIKKLFQEGELVAKDFVTLD